MNSVHGQVLRCVKASSCAIWHTLKLKDVQGPQLPTEAWPGTPYKGCETMMGAI